MGHDHEFVVIDADGKPHTYHLTLHPGGEGYELSLELTRLGLPLLGEAMSLVEDGADDATLQAAAKVAGEVLASVDGPALTERLLRHTWRDGAPVETVFDVAYRANYAELYQALAKVVAFNRFFPLPSTFYSAAESLAAATAA